LSQANGDSAPNAAVAAGDDSDAAAQVKQRKESPKLMSFFAVKSVNAPKR